MGKWRTEHMKHIAVRSHPVLNKQLLTGDKRFSIYLPAFPFFLSAFLCSFLCLSRTIFSDLLVSPADLQALDICGQFIRHFLRFRDPQMPFRAVSVPAEQEMPQFIVVHSPAHLVNRLIP